jgi:hypothetical protein
MTILMTIDLPVPGDVLQAVSNEMRVREDPPPGLIVHVMTEAAGGVHVVDVWNSEQEFTTFRDQRLMPAMAKVMANKGLPVPDTLPEADVTEASDLVRGV